MKAYKKALRYGAAIPVALGSTMALAVPDGAAIATEIGAANGIVDTAGTAMVTVVVGLMIFAIIIGMIRRKGS